MFFAKILYFQFVNRLVVGIPQELKTIEETKSSRLGKASLLVPEDL